MQVVISSMIAWLYVVGIVASIGPLARVYHEYEWFMYEREHEDGYRRYKPDAVKSLWVGVGLALVWPIAWVSAWAGYNITAHERGEIADRKKLETVEKARQVIKDDDEREKKRVEEALNPTSKIKKAIDYGTGFFVPPDKRKR